MTFHLAKRAVTRRRPPLLTVTRHEIVWPRPGTSGYKENVDKACISAEVVSCLVSTQFPHWAGLEVCPVALDGWDNTTFRLGDDMSVRLPSQEMYVPQVDKEHQWLPALAAQLPFQIPRPIAKGRPGCGFPRPWSVYGWLQGEPAAVVGVTDHDRLARDLGHFLAALQRVSTR